MPESKPEKIHNLSIWEQVDTTPPNFTRGGQVDGRIVTTINPTFMVKQATKIFGPIGVGWGYDIVDERFDNGRAIHFEGEIMGHEIDHTIKLELWYKTEDGERGSVTHFGHTKHIYWSHTYKSFIQEHEAPKKSLTDALKKCLSMLGFSADIFLGMYEDPTYVEAITQKAQIEEAEEADKALAEEREKFVSWVEGELENYSNTDSKAALKAMHRSNQKKVQRQCLVAKYSYEKVWKRFEQAYQNALKKGLGEVVCEECGDVTQDKAGNRCRECGGKKIEMQSKEGTQDE